MVKTYILAPNWTTAPPPDGPIKLGHLLDDLTEFVPVNRRGIVDIPTELLNKVDIKEGFQSTRSRLVSGELGLFAKVIGLVGVGAGAGIYYKKDSNDILSCKTLETMTFDPTAEYIAESMELPEVARYMKGCQFREPLYMITGFKIGRGGSLQSSNSQNRNLKLIGGLNPPGSPINIEGNVGFVREETESEAWEGSTDFVVAFRVRKIWYQKWDIRNKAHNKNVIMQGGAQSETVPDMNLQTSENVQGEEISQEVELMTGQNDDGEEGASWILPIPA
ncbi:hypothetical protein CDEST_02084 [Colletotrichum destructivum]|uniref:Uncharacterized protein n=1 Tax=Colletotrichum destructivum TaxID=34406 RepID=A0AAX4I289_9PEZI|nr:hypothetical protein CDEST_02084 [Colletotrichum destructivum]